MAFEFKSLRADSQEEIQRLVQQYTADGWSVDGPTIPTLVTGRGTTRIYFVRTLKRNAPELLADGKRRP
jgi:hypothetical protein